MTDPYKDTFKITERRDEDGRQRWGEPEYEQALAYIGHRLGLQGTFHLVGDVVKAFDQFMDSRPEGSARAQALHRYAVDHLKHALFHVKVAYEDLEKAQKVEQG